jgi:hypothetical protein
LARIDANSRKAKKRKLNCDVSDVGWFSSPPPGDAHPTAEKRSLGSQTTTADDPIAASPNHTGHPGVTDDAEASTMSQTSRKSPLSSGHRQGAATYAYRAAPSYVRSTPVDLAILASPSGAGSTAPVSPMPGQISSEMDRQQTLFSQGSSEPCNGGGAVKLPPHGKQKSGRRKKREGLKKRAASPAAVLPAIAGPSSMPTEFTSATPISAEIDGVRADTTRGGDGRTELDVGVSSMPTDTSPRQVINAQLEVQQAGSLEDDSTRKVPKTEPSGDDPALSMRAGLVVNDVSGHCEGDITTYR